MLQKREDPDKVKAGALAVLVHLLLLGGMLISFNWKAAHQVLNVAEVELWDKAPVPKSAPKPQPVVQVEPKPEIKPEPKPEPKMEEKPQPQEPKADIELEKKKKELVEKEKLLEQKKLEEKRKKEEEKQKLLADLREEDLKQKAEAKKEKDEALKRLQAEVDGEHRESGAKTSSAANAGEINEFKAKIQAKIRGNVNKTLCSDGNPKLRFTIALLPTGELNGSPKLVKSSGSATCDEAVERAIIASQPLPLPDDKSLFVDNFRNLTLNFEPNRAD